MSVDVNEIEDTYLNTCAQITVAAHVSIMFDQAIKNVVEKHNKIALLLIIDYHIITSILWSSTA